MSTEQTTTQITIKKGDVLFNEGDNSDYVYYIQSGHLAIYSTAKKKRVELGKVKSGEFVGELGVLQNTRRNASVIALEDTSLEQLPQTAFIKKISQDREKSQQLLHSLSYRINNVAMLSEQVAKQIAEHKTTLSFNPLSSLLTLASSAFTFIKKGIYKRERARHAKTLPNTKLSNGLHTIKKGKALFLEGQDSHFACLIKSGKFRAKKSLHNSHQDIATMHPGEYIGEMGLLQQSPRSLTVIALAHSEIEVFDEDAFLERISQDQDSFFNVVKHLSHRASVLNQHLKDLTETHAEIVNPSTLMQTKQLFQHIGHLSHVTGQMLEQDLNTLQNALALEATAVQQMLEVYYRFINGKASQEEMDQANADFRNFLKTLGLGALIIIPGSFITIPLIVKLGKSVGINILPKIRS